MEALYLKDHYLKEFTAKVVNVEGNFVYLDQTAFYPTGGGQPHDTGSLYRDKEEFEVVFTKKMSGRIAHQVEKEGLKIGDEVKGTVDWERRYRLMRVHTAAHILAETIHKETGALITGNQLDIDKSRIDFSLEDFDKDKLIECVSKSNEIIEKDLPIKAYFLPREEAMKIPQVTKLAKGLPESIKEVRIVEIGDYDKQADGGTHVKSTKEVGKIEFLKADNKGKNNRRVYYNIE